MNKIKRFLMRRKIPKGRLCCVLGDNLKIKWCPHRTFTADRINLLNRYYLCEYTNKVKIHHNLKECGVKEDE